LPASGGRVDSHDRLPGPERRSIDGHQTVFAKVRYFIDSGFRAIGSSWPTTAGDGGEWHTGRRPARIRPPQPTPEETSMLTLEKTADYVTRWVAAFESKDLDRVLAFYTNDVIFHSPLIARLSHDPSGTVQGKAALRAYVKKGFEVFDHIKFTVLDVLRGVDSIAIHYKGITGTHVVEVLFFDKDGLVRESYVHYAST
jgi:ketosteroid isomerase-like protein